jgi:hypothetical protein
MAVIGKADIGREPGEVAFAVRESLEHGAGAQPHAVTGDCQAGRSTKDAAEVMGRDRDGAGELGERKVGVGGERVPRVVHDARAGSGSCGTSGRDVHAPCHLQGLGNDRDRALDELVRITGVAARSQQLPLLDVDPRRRRQQAGRERRFVPPQ